MTTHAEALLRTTVPPIVLAPGRPRRAASADLTRRVARLAAALAALALPVLAVAAADAIHRVDDPGTMQAAAPVSPSAGAAAADHGLRDTFARRSGTFTGRLREARR